MVCATVPDPGPAGADPELDRFLADLVAPHGLAARVTEEPVTHADLGERLMHAIGPMDAPVDLVVIASAVPETDPRRSVAHRVSALCPGRPVAFAVADQGTAAPFTALSIVSGYRCDRVLLLILETGRQPYEVAARTPERATAVGLVLDGAGPTAITALIQHPAVGPAEIDRLLAGELAGRPRARLVLGSDAAPYVHRPPADEVRVASAGRICTAVWWELAAGLADWAADGRPVLVAEYDPALRYLSLLALEPCSSVPSAQSNR
jgi:4-hydroxymandelate oxidase